MIPPIDIFKVSTGGVQWLDSAANLEVAQTRVQQLAERSPGEYLLLDQVTGKKIVLKIEGMASAPGKRLLVNRGWEIQ